MRFLNLSIADDIPDSKTVWHFREQLTDLGMVEALFELFLTELDRLNLIVNEGKIIDASFVETPRQRNKKEENKQIKEGIIPERFEANPHACTLRSTRVKCQKDTDARWTQKNNVHYFGYTCTVYPKGINTKYAVRIMPSRMQVAKLLWGTQ